jgi:hypothetical protein
LELLKEIGAFAGLVAFLGLALLALLSFSQGRDLRRLREWAGSAPERDADRKEATSAAAAQRAEEMRKLEEAREAERRAAEQREERRGRREAGLPEHTRLERMRERLGEPRWLVAVFAVLLIVVGAAAYAALHGFGGGDGAAAGRTALKRSDVEVTVLNGTAVPGLAQHYGDMVERRGFKLGAVTNSSSSFTDSVVMYRLGHAPEARQVGRVLGISKLQPMTRDVSSISAGAPVSVIVGEDNASAAG